MVAGLAVAAPEVPRRKPAARPRVAIEEERRLRVPFAEEMTLGDLRDIMASLKNHPDHARVAFRADPCLRDHDARRR